MSEPETEPKIREIQISEETYELLERIAAEEGLTPEGAAQKIVAEHMKKLKTTTETVKLEIELPRNLYDAMKLITDTFKQDMEDFMVEAVKGELESLSSNLFERYTTELEKEFTRLLGETA